MSKKYNLLRDIDRVDEQIAELQGYLYDVELYPLQVQTWPRVKRFVYLFSIKRHVTRRIQHLHLRRRGLVNCYVYLFKEEPHSMPLEELREPAGSRR